jgi:hypothetical protein
MDNRATQFMGGSPGAVIFRLIVLSLIVGVILSVLGYTPQNLIYRLQDLAWSIYDLGFGAFDRVIGYLLLGAIIVIPVWLISRLMRTGRGQA